MDALLCGVGDFEGFDDNNNLIVSAKVLTDSSINMAVENAEARGGQGNILVGKYYFGSSFGMTLTDAGTRGSPRSSSGLAPFAASRASGAHHSDSR